MSSVNPSNHRWISYLDNVLLDVDETNMQTPFTWSNQQTPENQNECSAEDCAVKSDGGDETDKDPSSSKKRNREESTNDAYNKANREKMRRDRLNDRFVELSQALDPERPPKLDKATILCDAARIITQLRSEAIQLRDSNNQLKEQIKELKAEKIELREDKIRLKTEKERLESHIKSLTVTPGYAPHHSAIQSAMALFSSQAFAHAQMQQQMQPQGQTQGQTQGQVVGSFVKPGVMMSYPNMPMWPWLPSSLDNPSKDSTLRPPVA